MLIYLLHLFFNFALGQTPVELKLDYYEQLINNQVEKAWTNQIEQNSNEFRPKTTIVKDGGTYDYIVVGAGSAGSVMATRLSEIENATVLLLEAGEFENDFVQIPSYFIYNQGLVNWNYTSTPQTTCCKAYINNACVVPRGRVTGGTSVLNALMYVRGNKRNYDQWAESGLFGWGYNDVLPYFIKSENAQFDAEPNYYGVGGYLNVEYYSGPVSPQTTAFFDASKQINIPFVSDSNGREQVGVSHVQLNTLDGSRDSSSHAFLTYALKRHNLHLSLRSLVTRILFKKKMAAGVEFSRNRQLFRASALREVIVCAGAINTPQLLMLSGIGPRDHLREMRMRVIEDLPVGYNYIDHPAFLQLLITTNITYNSPTLRNELLGYFRGVGSLTIPGNSQAMIFHRSSLAKTNEAPDIELILIPTPSLSDYQKRAYGYTEESWKEITGSVNPSNVFNIFAVNVQPRSRGRIMLKTKSAYDYPLVDVRYLSDRNDEDIRIIYEGIEIVEKLLKTKKYQEMNATFAYTPLRECRNHVPFSRDYWYCQLRALTLSMYHPMGTCRMSRSRQSGVVDRKLRVFGVRRLRIADASVIPFPISGHTSAPSMMIAEKLADFIKFDRLY